jgi:hypothetical protein
MPYVSGPYLLGKAPNLQGVASPHDQPKHAGERIMFGVPMFGVPMSVVPWAAERPSRDLIHPAGLVDPVADPIDLAIDRNRKPV